MFSENKIYNVFYILLLIIIYFLPTAGILYAGVKITNKYDENKKISYKIIGYILFFIGILLLLTMLLYGYDVITYYA